MTNLYSFRSINCQNGGAPRLSPLVSLDISSGSSNYISQVAGNGVVIDVVNGFQWTTSPPGTQSRQEVPGVELVEKRIKTNTVIAAAAYYLMSGTSSLNNIMQQAKGVGVLNNVLGDIQKEIGNLLNTPGASNLGSGVSNFFKDVFSSTGLGYSVNSGPIDNFLASGQIEGLNSKYLEPYEGMYITEDTGFKYWLPYFSDSIREYANFFTEDDATFNANTNLGGGVQQIRNAATALARFSYFMEPGLYIERPKFYSFEGNGERVEITFPLINTGWSTYNDVLRNWQLVFLLTYQNRPNRRSRELIDPVCIYEVNIPGTKYIPYAYFSQIKIDSLGSRRMMNLEVPTPEGISTIQTIVPDAYNVTLTLDGLVPTSRNFLAAMLNNKQDIINVASYNTFNAFGEIWKNFDKLLTSE